MKKMEKQDELKELYKKISIMEDYIYDTKEKNRKLISEVIKLKNRIKDLEMFYENKHLS